MMRNGNGFGRRTMAFLLAVVLVLSTFGSTSITGYAAEPAADAETVTEVTQIESTDAEETDESEAIPSEEVTTEEEETTVETTAEPEETVTETTEESTETVAEEGEALLMAEPADDGETLAVNEPVNDGETTYTGTPEEEADKRTNLKIDYWEYQDEQTKAGAEVTFNDATIIGILEANKETTYDIVTINYNVTDTNANKALISKEVWNAVVQRLKTDGSATEARINFGGGTTSDENWNFANPSTTEADINTSLTMKPGEAGKGISLSFESISFPAEDVYVSFHTERTSDGERTDFAGIAAAFGNEKTYQLCIVDKDGNSVENVGGQYNYTDTVNEDGTSTRSDIDFGIGNIKNLTAKTEYTIVEYVYKGRIDTWEDD